MYLLKNKALEDIDYSVIRWKILRRKYLGHQSKVYLHGIESRNLNLLDLGEINFYSLRNSQQNIFQVRCVCGGVDRQFEKL